MSISEKLTAIAENEQKVYDKGKVDSRKEFWNSYINNMNNNYNSLYAFAGFGWTDKTFRPTKNMKIYNAQSMFNSSKITNLAEILEELDVSMNFSSCGSFNSFAYGSTITHFPVISTISSSSLHGMFNGCNKTHTIDKLILKNDGTQTFTSTFDKCSSLANITIEGVIGNSVSFGQSPLSKESIINIFEHLSETATGKTLTLKKTAVNEAFGIDVDDSTTFPEGSEYYILRHSRDNWSVGYA